MSAQNMMANEIEPDGKWLYQVGSTSAFLIGIAYLITTVLYAYVGASPRGGEAKLIYLADHAGSWWAIFGLMVLTDFLFIPVGLSLYLLLKGINRDVMLLATACVALFVVLDVAVTWTSYASLITLSGHYATATNDAQRAVFVAAANYPSALLDSILASICAILTLSTGILLIGFVMLRGIFHRITAYLGLLTGISGIVAVTGPLFLGALSVATIINAVLATAWIMLVGYRLCTLSEQ